MAANIILTRIDNRLVHGQVGNMHYAEGKRQFTTKIYLDEQDTEDLRYIASKGIEVYGQDTPDDRKVTGF